MADILFAVRNLFYLGAYQACINEAQDIETLSSVDQVERDTFVHRAYIALGNQQLVTSEIPDSAAMGLLAVKLFAQFSAGTKSKEDCLETIKGWMEDPVSSLNPTVCLMAGLMYAGTGNYVESLKACHSASTLETQALMVQIYLKMDREDQAEKLTKAMSAADDDATLTQLATAWTGLALGGAKVQEAAYIYQELGDKYTWTAQLHNGLGAANMKMGRWEEAERDFQDALQKDGKDADTLANMVACALHLGKPHARYMTQLKMQCPEHAVVLRTASAEEAFDRAAVAAV